MMVWVAALLGAAAGFLGGLIAYRDARKGGEPATLESVNQELGGIAGLLMVITVLLGGIFGVMLYQALR
jgi:hypothetical protein